MRWCPGGCGKSVFYAGSNFSDRCFACPVCERRWCLDELKRYNSGEEVEVLDCHDIVDDDLLRLVRNHSKSSKVEERV